MLLGLVSVPTLGVIEASSAANRLRRRCHAVLPLSDSKAKSICHSALPPHPLALTPLAGTAGLEGREHSGRGYSPLVPGSNDAVLAVLVL
ncbi:unnamed protein product [Protopolystoma xenopodis]|uniref:Uncharacterized protein n=1 Tax=Protopolystoma xenopodis TaxID=117903 RepID=A0A3S5AMW8_9PLAT|nr:unnamed protein product [Protopolystoma xenopodis]